MGSVAAGMAARGYKVTGSDQNVYPPMSTFLESQGIEIQSGYRAENIPEGVDTIVIGNAISRGNPEAEEVLNRKLLYQSLPEVMRNYFLGGKRNLVVTGTHGKTTTSAMLAWLLKDNDRDPSWMIGGIPGNLGKGAYFGDGDFTVLEGDEYDTAFFDKRSKFLHYLPDVVVMNNMEFDHADIYNDISEIQLTFSRVLKVVPMNGMAFINGDDENCLIAAENAPCPITKVGVEDSCDLKITDIVYQEDESLFALDNESYSVPMVGEFNVRNAAMAVASARFVGLSPEECQKGLTSFNGIARRQQVRGVARGITVVDDFAHHPTAVELAIAALRQKFPRANRLITVFEPRSNTTRRKFFQKELASSLQGTDLAIVAPVPNPEKDDPSDRLDVNVLIEDIKASGTPAKTFDSVDGIITYLNDNCVEGDVVSVLSNGGFENIHTRLLDLLKR